ncbi:MAG TPA: hypothetical protein VF508_04150, partial [Pyrinomonadaceae bacterium]
YQWDIGAFVPDGDPAEGWRAGSLRFRLEGARLGGAWRLFRMKGRAEQGRPLWLLQKLPDEFAAPGHEADTVGEREPPKPAVKKSAVKRRRATKKR